MVALTLIRPSSLAALSDAFERWKQLCRRKIPGRPEEIKSTQLSDEMCRSFVNKVVFAPGVYMWYCVYGVDVDGTTLEWGRLQRDHFASQYRAQIPIARAEGREKWARQAATLAGWIGSTPPRMQIKMAVLNVAVLQSLNQAIVESVVGGFDRELGELSWAIDLGFLKDRSTSFWKELLRSGMAQVSQREPIIQITDWPADHPFLVEFVSEGRGKYTKLNPELPKRIDFHDSSDSIEIQVADIIAGIMRKKYIDGWRRPYMTKLKERILRKESAELHLLQFAELVRFDRPLATSNIYEEFEHAPKASEGRQ